MDTDDLNIQQYLAYSKQLHRLSTDHLQETQQLLDMIEQLQNIVEYQATKIRHLEEEKQAKDATIQAQTRRIADLQQNTSVTVHGDYIENQNIKHQYTTTTTIPLPAKRRTAPRKLNYNDPNQLSLWNATST